MGWGWMVTLGVVVACSDEVRDGLRRGVGLEGV